MPNTPKKIVAYNRIGDASTSVVTSTKHIHTSAVEELTNPLWHWDLALACHPPGLPAPPGSETSEVMAFSQPSWPFMMWNHFGVLALVTCMYGTREGLHQANT